MAPADTLKILIEIEQILEQRKKADPQTSYTASLYQGGHSACADKIQEEANELIDAALGDDPQHTVNEAADLLFHIQVLLSSKGISITAVCDELKRRFGTSGHEEKRQRNSD